MDSQCISKELLRLLPGAQLLSNEPMDRHTTFRVGGPADWMLFARSAEEIARARRFCREEGVPCTILGNGSNVVVRDGGLRGLVILIGEGMSDCRFEGTKAVSQAGRRLTALSRDALLRGLAGLEFAGGIPGTVGGAVCMNAGAYGGEMKDALAAVTYLDESDKIVRRVVQEGDFSYRNSIFLKNGWIVTEAEFALAPDDGQARARYDDYSARRRQKQPLSYPSAGSTFKRPEGHYAGALIEQAGLKGVSVGGAQVSELHAGFVVNRGGATAQDILSLIALIQTKVLEQSGVLLEPEVRVLGEDLPG